MEQKRSPGLVGVVKRSWRILLKVFSYRIEHGGYEKERRSYRQAHLGGVGASNGRGQDSTTHPIVGMDSSGEKTD